MPLVARVGQRLPPLLLSKSWAELTVRIPLFPRAGPSSLPAPLTTEPQWGSVSARAPPPRACVQNQCPHSLLGACPDYRGSVSWSEQGHGRLLGRVRQSRLGAFMLNLERWDMTAKPSGEHFHLSLTSTHTGSHLQRKQRVIGG